MQSVAGMLRQSLDDPGLAEALRMHVLGPALQKLYSDLFPYLCLAAALLVLLTALLMTSTVLLYVMLRHGP